MGNGAPETLASALLALPERPGRGFRCISRAGDETELSWAALKLGARRLATALHQQGVTQNERIVLITPDPEDFVLAFFGIVLAGAVPVPMPGKAPFRSLDAYHSHLAHVIRASDAHHLLTDASVIEGADMGTLCEQADALTLLDIAALRSEAAGAEPYAGPLPSPDDLCFLQFTSGSTSHPKGVRVLHRNLVANSRAFLGAEGLKRSDADLGLSWLPLYHDMGLIGFVLGPVVCDIPVVLIATERFAKLPRMWLEEISARKATITFAPNFAYRLVTRRVRDRDLESLDLSSLRVCGCGAEPIQSETLHSFAERFAAAGFSPRAFAPCYGMAESTLAISFTRPSADLRIDTVDAVALAEGRVEAAAEGPDANRLVGCGQPFTGHELRIVSTEGHTLGERAVGEIWVRGPSIADGYEGLDAPESFDAEGWLHTGDLGYLAEGEVFICGRLKDLIIVNGANHFPQDIEWIVTTLEGVREAGAVAYARPGAQGEELVVAAETRAADADRLREEISQAIARETGIKPAWVATVPPGSLPKTSSGKIQRQRTRMLLESGDLLEHADAPSSAVEASA